MENLDIPFPSGIVKGGRAVTFGGSMQGTAPLWRHSRLGEPSVAIPIWFPLSGMAPNGRGPLHAPSKVDCFTLL